jgi:uncharacterized CHY-type Zn-finger protein
MNLRYAATIIGFAVYIAGTLPVLADSTTVSEKRPSMGEDSVTSIPTLSQDYFPCTTCHEKGKTNNQRRQLKEEHADLVFDHDAENRWCLDCHAALDRDKLHLASGEPIEFGQSYRLCGQCHGPTYRDWKAGVHGKRTGMWNGRKNYYLCVHCHNPHSPAIKPITPFPAPPPPVGKPFLFGGKHQ